MTGRELDALMKDHARRSERTSHAEALPDTWRRMGYTETEVACLLGWRDEQTR